MKLLARIALAVALWRCAASPGQVASHDNPNTASLTKCTLSNMQGPYASANEVAHEKGANEVGMWMKVCTTRQGALTTILGCDANRK